MAYLGTEGQCAQLAHGAAKSGGKPTFAGPAALLAGLAAASTGLIALLFFSRGDIALGTKVDQIVSWVFMMGGPVGVTVWFGLVLRRLVLSVGRLAALYLLLAVLISVGQSLTALLTSQVLVFGREHGITLRDLAAAYAVLTPVVVTVMAVLVSWGLIRILAGPAPATPRGALRTASDCGVAVVALGFGLVVYIGWIERIVIGVEWSDFFPSGWSSAAKVSLALIFGIGVTLTVRPFVSRVPAFTWLIGAPWAAAMAGLSIWCTSWALAQLWGADLQLAHGLLGFVSAMLLCSMLCLLPLKVWQCFRRRVAN